MVAMNLKAETMALTERRASMESEMNAIIGHLCGPGGPGISGNLVDSEGFPRSDIDIPAIRSRRSRLSALRNDHKDITAKIEQNLQLLFSNRLAKDDVSHPYPENSASSTSVVDAASQASHMDVDPIEKVPFAIIDELSDASPAADDGLQLGDQVVKFGNVELGDNLLSRLASEAQSNQGHAIALLVIRQGVPMRLTVTPREWNGRGLLGCHFHIL